jgi:hypothetical protein
LVAVNPARARTGSQSTGTAVLSAPTTTKFLNIVLTGRKGIDIKNRLKQELERGEENNKQLYPIFMEIDQHVPGRKAR